MQNQASRGPDWDSWTDDQLLNTKLWVAGLSAALGAGLALMATAAYCLFDAFYLPMMWLV